MEEAYGKGSNNQDILYEKKIFLIRRNSIKRSNKKLTKSTYMLVIQFTLANSIMKSRSFLFLFLFVCLEKLR